MRSHPALLESEDFAPWGGGGGCRLLREEGRRGVAPSGGGRRGGHPLRGVAHWGGGCGISFQEASLRHSLGGITH